MFQTHDAAALSAGPGGARAAPEEPEAAALLPRQATSVRDTGLEPRLVTELVVKAIEAHGKTPLPVLSSKLRLSISVLREVLGQLIAQQQVEVAWCGDSDIDVQYQLTGHGQKSAAEYLAQSRYVGPAPVPLAAWRSVVERQSPHRPGAVRVAPAMLDAALAEDGLDPALREVLGAAMHSHRSLLLYGPSGSGKSTLALQLGRLLQGPVAVPYALLAGRQIIQFHDPLLHPAPAPLARQHEERRSCDARWAICQRPVVHLGAGLSGELLELRHDTASNVLRAPPHLQANNGMLVVDDVGRQRLPVAEMLNRWMTPLEQGIDQLTLPGGHSETVPFDVAVVFITGMAPQQVFDEGFLRRIGYKVALGALSEPAYRALLRRQCRLRGIDDDERAAAHLLALHARSGRKLLAGSPSELLGRIADFASFAGTEPRLTPAALDQAWHSMFAHCEEQS
jgi:energy-coupling factor transporter ATP-binding protein EcfA2